MRFNNMVDMNKFGSEKATHYTVEFAGNKGRKIDVVAASEGIWNWTFKCGSKPIAPGGSMQLYCEYPKFWLTTIAQVETPDKPGYVSLHTSDGLKAELTSIQRNWKSLAWATIILPEGMSEGQELTVRFGSKKHPCTAVVHKYLDALISWKVDYLGTGELFKLWPPMVVNVVPDKAAKFYVVLPSKLALGQTLLIKGRIEDKNSNIGASYQHPITLELLSEDGTLNPGYRTKINALENGIFIDSSWVINTPGIYRVCAKGPGLLDKLSNPVKVETAVEEKIVWGDMHCHTVWADGVGTLQYNLEYARDEAFLDVFGFGEHLFTNTGYDTQPVDKKSSDWSIIGPHVAKTLNEAHVSGEFVTILGYEYSPMNVPSAAGDFCVFSSSDKWDDLPMAFEFEDLVDVAKDHQAIAIPHVGGRIPDLDTVRIDPEVTPVLEMASMHGHFESFAQKALQNGYKLGFVGMSDGHFGMPGYDNWAQHGRTPKLAHRNYSVQSAITGFVVDELTREAVFEAMRKRHTYVTTGQRILLDFRINNKVMGTVLTTDDLPTVGINVHGTAPIAFVDIIRGDKRVERIDGRGKMDLAYEWIDAQPLTKETWYYIRVTQEDCSLAWSSPIWVNYQGDLRVSTVEDFPSWAHGAYFPGNWADKEQQAQYLERIRSVFAKRNLMERFTNLEFIGIYTENRGRFALFYANDSLRSNLVVHIHLYVDFRDDRLYIADGINDYGISF